MKKVLFAVMLTLGLFISNVSFAQAVVVTSDNWQNWRWREENYGQWKKWHHAHNKEWYNYGRENREDYDRWCYYHPYDCRGYRY